jgi:hypothetical protein
MCEWGRSQPWTWARGVGHLWRTTGDIADRWNSWTRLLDQQVGLEKYAGPGGWNDPDMLEVGNGGMTAGEYRAHFGFWCLLASPLMAGNDLRSMTPETRDILTNKEVIAIDQDPLGAQGRKIRDDDDLEVWAKRLSGGAQAVILFNRGRDEQAIAVSWQEIGLLTTRNQPCATSGRRRTGKVKARSRPGAVARDRHDPRHALKGVSRHDVSRRLPCSARATGPKRGASSRRRA